MADSIASEEHYQQRALFEPYVHLTRPLKAHRRGAELCTRVDRALRYFPELERSRVTVGVTRIADGVAIFEDMTVRFDLRRRLPSYYTIAHELTHLLQALRLVPGGEIQCDIWTLARSRLFLDEAPCYLPLPVQLQSNWRRYAPRVRYLCGHAISERPTRRYYIRWLNQQLELLAG